MHLQLQYSSNNEPASLKMSSQLIGIRTVHHAMNIMLAGFTTVKDAGSSSSIYDSLSLCHRKGWIDGSRIIAEGSVGITGSHTDASGIKPDLMEFYTDRLICDGAHECNLRLMM